MSAFSLIGADSPRSTRAKYSGSSTNSLPTRDAHRQPHTTPINVDGMQTIKTSINETPAGASSPTNATVAAEIGQAVIACCDAMTDIEIGRSGRTPASRATSAITGRMPNAMLPVPHMNVKTQLIIGA